MAKYKRYEKYKDSGVEWMGKVPYNWSNSKIAWSFGVIGSGGTPTSTKQEYYDGDINWLITGDLNDGIINSTSKKITELALKECSTLKKYPKGSLIVAMYGATIGKLGITEIQTTTNQACCVLTKPIDVDVKYMFYWFLGNRNEIINLSQGGGQPNISQSLVKSLKLLKPSIEEQKQIAYFLDKKIAEIDSILWDKEKLITLLEEKKQAIITGAVTKGLNPNVRLKKSGSKWIGTIPEQWNTSSVRNLIRKNFVEVQDGNHGELHPTSDDYVNDGIPFVMASDIRNGKIDLKSCKYISKETKEKLRIGFSIRNDVLLTHKGTIGEVGINDIESECVVLTPQVTYYRIKADKIISSNFLYYYFQSECIQNQLKYISSMQSTRQYIGIVAQRELIITLPNIEEQITIVDYLKNKVGLLEEIINLEKLQIKKLKEYRQSIISEAVTGKIDVRNYYKEA